MTYAIFRRMRAAARPAGSRKRARIPVSALVLGGLLGCAAALMFAQTYAAQAPGEATAEVTAASAPSAASAPAAAAATAPATASFTASFTLPAQVERLPIDEQVRWLRHAAQSGTLERLDDAQLVALFESLDPLTVPRYIEEGPNGYPSYEFTMWRQERIRGVWPDRADHMLVRLTREPMRIYAKWLPDGAHSGQEVIYDESKRRDEMYGHLGGLLSVIPLWASVNGTLAHAQSRHEVRDLGTEYIANQFVSEGRKFAEAGIKRPGQIEVKIVDGVRVVAFTYETPTGQPEFYAKKEMLGLDLRHPWFRCVESYDNDGRIFEKIVFETITPRSFDEMAFDPKNPAYKF